MDKKRLISFITSLAMVIACFSSLAGFAENYNLLTESMTGSAAAYTEEAYSEPLTIYKVDEDIDGSYDYIEVAGCDTSAVSVEIPSQIYGLPVTSIKASAFEGCSDLESVIIPDSVISIGDKAFYDCTSLENIVIENAGCDIYDSPDTIEGTAVIFGIENSTAKDYASAYEREFEPLGKSGSTAYDASNESVVTSISVVVSEPVSTSVSVVTSESVVTSVSVVTSISVVTSVSVVTSESVMTSVSVVPYVSVVTSYTFLISESLVTTITIVPYVSVVTSVSIVPYVSVVTSVAPVSSLATSVSVSVSESVSISVATSISYVTVPPVTMTGISIITVTSIVSVPAVTATGVRVEPNYPIYGNKCGTVIVKSMVDRDVYVTIMKNTPEGNLKLYDYIIPVSASNKTYEFILEGKNDADYTVTIGVPKYNVSNDLELYSENIVVPDTDYLMDVAGYKYTYTIEKNEIEEVTATKTKENVKGNDNVIDTDTIVLFPVIDRIIGDANGDDAVNIRDAAYIAVALAASYKGGIEGFELNDFADYNGDGKVNVRDAVEIAKFVSVNLAEKVGSRKLERDNSSSRSIGIDSAIAVPGETVSLPINISCNDNFESAAALIEWDDTDLLSSKAAGAGGVSCASDAGKGYCSIAAFGSQSVENGTIATIDFTIPEDAEVGTVYDIYFSYIDTFAEFKGEDAADTVSVYGGSITVIPEPESEYVIHEGESIEFPEGFSIFNIVADNFKIVNVINNTLKGISAGTANLTFSYMGRDFNSKVVVKIPENIEMNVGEQKYLFISDEELKIKWVTSNKSTASVENGVLTALSEGTAAITAIDAVSGATLYSGTVTVNKRVATAVSDNEPSETTSTSLRTIKVVSPVQPAEDYNDDNMPAPSVYLSNISGSPGETVTMLMRDKCNNNLESLNLILGWDDPSLTSSVPYPVGSASMASDSFESGCSIAAFGSNPISDGEICAIDFTIPKNAETGTVYDIYFSDISTFCIWEGEDLGSEVPNYGGTITVTGDNYTRIPAGSEAVLIGDYDIYDSIISDDSSVAYVEDGVLYAVSEGTTDITFINSEKSVILPINVYTSDSFKIGLYEEKHIFHNDIYYRDLVWTSSDTFVATVDEDGTVYGASGGVAVIRAIDAKTGEIIYQGTVTVNTQSTVVTTATTSDSVTTKTTAAKTSTSKVTTATSEIFTTRPTGPAVVTTSESSGMTTPSEVTTAAEETTSTEAATPDTDIFDIKENNGKIIIINCDKLVVNVIIPAAIDGKVVSEISQYALSGEDIETVKFDNPDIVIADAESTINEKAVIYGYWNSTAHDYAKKYDREFVSLDGEPQGEQGDANGDGKLNVRDAAFIAQKLAQGMVDELPPEADFNGDGKINVRDAAAIAKFLATGKK